jgi:acetyl-CoA C-acetyltransferase
MTGFIATKLAMNDALKAAGVKLDDISILELYDQSTMMGMVSLEDLGLCEKGKAWIDIHKSCQKNDESFELNGKNLFVNVNGGLKADGNPLGATGGAEVFEIVQQLRQEAGERQIKADDELRYGCVHEMEGFGTKAYIYILGME